MATKMELEHMKKIKLQYMKKINIFLELNDDNEDGHMEQDEIYRKFIKDICSNKFKSMNEIKKIALLLKEEVVKLDIDRWYS
jgi:hypothetical protein